MKKLLFLLLFLALPSVAQAQFSQTEINYLKTMMSQWITAGSSLGGAGHTIQEDGSDLTQRSTLNFTGTGITCTDAGGKTVCDVPAGTVDQTADYSWTGTQSFLRNKFEIKDNTDPTKIITFNNSGNTTKTARDYTLPDASTTLVGTGIANTWSTGAQDMGSATSFKVPVAAGAGPTTSGLIAYDSTSNTFEWGANGSNKIALADPGANGFLDRTAAGTVVNRTLTIGAGSANYLTIANGGGGGVPTFNLGPNVLATDRTNTITTGDQSFAAASSLTVPVATGAAPTVSGRIAYDSTANRYKFGANGSTITIPTLAEIQPLNANLTAMSNLIGSANALVAFTGPGATRTWTLANCPDTGGGHLNWTSASGLTCGTSSTGGLSGLAASKYLIATGATAADTSGALSEAAGVIGMTNGFTTGATPFLIIDTSGVAASDKTWTVLNFSGTIRPSTGVLTAGNIVTTDANGLLVDGGAPGTGTWTDSSKNAGTNKSFDFVAAAAGNAITLPLQASWDGGSMTPDGTNCTDPTRQTINSGPTGYYFSCADSDSSTFDGQVTIPATAGTVGTVIFILTVNDVDSSSEHFAGEFKAMCRNNNTTVNGTWGAGQTVDITMVTASNNYTGTTAAVTPNGTCSSGATLFWRFTVAGSGAHTDGGNARVIGVAMKQAS